MNVGKESNFAPPEQTGLVALFFLSNTMYTQHLWLLKSTTPPKNFNRGTKKTGDRGGRIGIVRRAPAHRAVTYNISFAQNTKKTHFITRMRGGKKEKNLGWVITRWGPTMPRWDYNIKNIQHFCVLPFPSVAAAAARSKLPLPSPRRWHTRKSKHARCPVSGTTAEDSASWNHY